MHHGLGMRRRRILQAGGSLMVAGLGAPPAFAADAAKPLVRVVKTSATLGLSLSWVLKQQGYLKQMGVETSYTNVSDASKVNGALISDNADLCTGSGFSSIFPAIERGATLKIVAGALLLPDEAVFSAKPDIKSIKDLRGRTIGSGAAGGLVNQLMVAILHKNGIEPKDVTFVDIGSNTDVFRAVSMGTVDAGPSSYDVYDQQAKYGVHSLVGGDLWSELPEFTNQAAFASHEAIAANRDGVVRVLAAYIKLYRYLQDPSSKDSFAQARIAVTGKDDPAETASQWGFFQKYQPFAVDPVLSEARITYMQKLNYEVGMQKKILPYDQVTDMSIARDAHTLAG